jgi:glycerophosphoryl diester phosphodiesterase
VTPPSNKEPAAESAARSRRRRRHYVLVAIAAAFGILYLLNASWPAAAPHGVPTIIAHRGVAQQFDRTDLGRQDCTATRIRRPVHPFLENTLPSISEAFRLGADIVEVDVSMTRDGRVVLFHDWLLNCRTNGSGEVRAKNLAELKALDIGYGYTADGGRSFPFRGHGVGMMPTLQEALQAFPGKRLLIHFKSRNPAEADAVAAEFRRAGVMIGSQYAFYGNGAVLRRMRRYAPQSWIFDLGRGKACAKGYLAWGWIGHVPGSCRGGTIAVPANLRWLAWGWPNRFLTRLDGVGARTLFMGDLTELKAPAGLERPDELAKVPEGFSGYLWVEDINALHSALADRRRVRRE